MDPIRKLNSLGLLKGGYALDIGAGNLIHSKQLVP